MAIRDGRAALRLAQKHGTAMDQANARSHLGSAFAQQGNFHRAEREFRAAAKVYQRAGDLYQLSEINKRLGTIYSNIGDPAKAATHLEQARQGWQKLGNQVQLSLTLNNMAVMYYQQGRYETAESLARESLSLAPQASSSPRREAYTQITLADIQRDQGKYAESIASCQRGMQLAKKCMETHLVCYGLICNGETHRLAGDSETARALLLEASELGRQGDQPFELGLGLTSLGIIEYEERHYHDSEVLLTEACQVLSQSGHKWALTKSRLHLAQCHFLSKRYAKARDQMESVARLCGELGYDRFLLPEGRRALLLIEYAAKRCENKDFFARLSEQINREAASKPAGALAPVNPTLTRAAASPRLEVFTLGSLNILLDGHPILNTAWVSSKAREMFLFLLYKGASVPKDKIVESLWPEISSSKVNSNFHSTLYRLRAALFPNCVDHDGELYRLNPHMTYWSDTVEFQGLLSEAGQLPEDSPQRESLLDSAVKLYRGPFSEETDTDWSNELRTNLEFRYLKAVRGLAQHREASGAYQESIALLERALAVDELQEDIHYKIMDLYLELGDQVSANRAYHRCISVIGENTHLTASAKVSGLLAHLN